LKVWLRQASPVLPDDGFSQRVLAALPSSRASTARAPFRALISVFAGGAGAAFAWWQIVASRAATVLPTRFESAMEEIKNALNQSATPAWDQALTLAVLATAGSLFFAFRPSFRFRWRWH
jgi:hypothetical protein